MKDKMIELQVAKFSDLFYSVNWVYEEYARRTDYSYTTLEILMMIRRNDGGCTQKSLCERTFLPKQTVNNVITSFYKNGLVELKELPSDRRNKTIHLTKEGKCIAEKFIPKVHEAEYEAFERMDPEQRQALLQGMEQYCEIFRKALLEEK